MRSGPWKAVRLRVHEDRSAPVQLFDLRSDPGEEDDVAADHPEVAAELTRLMDGAHVRSPRRMVPVPLGAVRASYQLRTSV